RGKALLQEFTDKATKAGVRNDTLLSMGVVANEIAEHAKTADLVVIGHRGVNERFSTGLLGSTAESTTRKSPKTVFLCPLESRASTYLRLAYDGSQRASVAMQSAVVFCTTLSLPLTVLTVNKDEAIVRRALEEADTYLRPYHLALTTELQQTGNAPERIA